MRQYQSQKAREHKDFIPLSATLRALQFHYHSGRRKWRRPLSDRLSGRHLERDSRRRSCRPAQYSPSPTDRWRSRLPLRFHHRRHWALEWKKISLLYKGAAKAVQALYSV